MTGKDIRRATSRKAKDLHAESLALKAVVTDLTLENLNLLENDDLEGEREAASAAFVAYCSHRRYHESLGNLTPTDLSFGRGTGEDQTTDHPEPELDPSAPSSVT